MLIRKNFLIHIFFRKFHGPTQKVIIKCKLLLLKESNKLMHSMLELTEKNNPAFPVCMLTMALSFWNPQLLSMEDLKAD